jgi:hypothetical protein
VNGRRLFDALPERAKDVLAVLLVLYLGGALVAGAAARAVVSTVRRRP